MNSQSRLLPHLNLCYLQKKSYDAHRKKILAIKQSLRVSLAKKMSSFSECHSLDVRLSRKDSANKMSTIKQQGSSPKQSRVRLLKHGKYFDQLKENQRLLKKIETCEPTINRKIIQAHKLRSEQYKNRISKFKNDPGSHKSLLKSQHSLQILQKSREKEKLKQLVHFFDQGRRSKVNSTELIYQKSQSSLTKLQNLDSPKVKTEIRQNSSKKSSLKKLMARRNRQQIQNHFYKQNFSYQAGKKFNLQRQHQRYSQFKRLHTQVSQNFWKSRCFTTQLQNHS